jgi:hypothetical protein
MGASLRRDRMSISHPKLKQRFGHDDASNTALEEDMRELIHANVGPMPNSPAEHSSDMTSDAIGPLVQKIGATSITEIEVLIGQLEAARNYLKSEADRIQQEIARYEHQSNTAFASMKSIKHRLGQWRNASTNASVNVVVEGEPSL